MCLWRILQIRIARFESMELTDLISLLLVIILLFLGFRLMEFKWSYKISKPYKWDKAVNSNLVSPGLKKLERTYRDKVRFYSIWLQIERLKEQEINGAFAELGVYKGMTAKIIHLMDDSRQLHLFDTFEGFSNKDLTVESEVVEDPDKPNFIDTSLEMVKSFVNGNDNVSYYPGYFPDSAPNLKESNYAFVHLDADLYNPTLAGLQYFYPKLSPGGVIIIHDYNHNWDGVRRAVDEFAPTIPESLIEIADWQGSVMIVKNTS